MGSLNLVLKIQITLNLLRNTDLQNSDILVSFNVLSLFTNVPVDETLEVISKKLHNDHILSGSPTLPVEAVMELLEVCLRTTYFQVDESYYQQKERMAMGISLPTVVSNIHMEHFESWL
jgi:hypothetical protein